MPRAYSTGGTESRRRERSRAGESAGWLYLIGEEWGSNVKIGYCASEAGLARRVAELQTGNPRRLYLIATCRGTLEAERQLHQRFADRRVLGEWFKSNRELQAIAQSWNRVERAA